MLSDRDGFIHLPNEYIIYQSPKRTALSLKPVNSKESFSVSSNGGQLYLTNQRVRIPFLVADFKLLMCRV